jgi:hypothetical protein
MMDLGAKGGGQLALVPCRFTPGIDPIPIVQEAGWAPWPVWTGAENLVHKGMRSQVHPACGELLYRLSYAGSTEPECKIFENVSCCSADLVFFRTDKMGL